MTVAAQSRSGGAGTTLLLSLVVAGLAYVNWLLLDMQVDISPLAPAAAPTEAANASELAIVTRLDGKPLPQFLQTVARPLFSPIRRPAVVAGKAPVPAPAPAPIPTPTADGLRLIGVIKTEGGEVRALIRSADEPFGTWVAEGGEIAGWRLTAIGNGKVTIESKGLRYELSLYAPGGDTPDADR